MLCSAGWISVHNDYMHLADYTRAHARVEDMDRRRVNFRTCTKIYANASTPTSSPLATTTSANDLHYIDLNYNDPNNYAKLYDNTKIYVELPFLHPIPPQATCFYMFATSPISRAIPRDTKRKSRIWMSFVVVRRRVLSPPRYDKTRRRITAAAAAL
jgi:hypothetical protein